MLALFLALVFTLAIFAHALPHHEQTEAHVSSTSQVARHSSVSTSTSTSVSALADVEQDMERLFLRGAGTAKLATMPQVTASPHGQTPPVQTPEMFPTPNLTLTPGPAGLTIDVALDARARLVQFQWIAVGSNSAVATWSTAVVRVRDVTSARYVADGLAANAGYFVRARAWAFGLSPSEFAEAQAYTLPDESAGSAPAPAPVSDLSVLSVSSTTVQLAFSVSPGDRDCQWQAQHIRADRIASSGVWTQTELGACPETSSVLVFTLAGLEPGVGYFVRVRGVRSGGRAAPFSQPHTFVSTVALVAGTLPSPSLAVTTVSSSAVTALLTPAPGTDADATDRYQIYSTDDLESGVWAATSADAAHVNFPGATTFTSIPAAPSQAVFLRARAERVDGTWRPSAEVQWSTSAGAAPPLVDPTPVPTLACQQTDGADGVDVDVDVVVSLRADTSANNTGPSFLLEWSDDAALPAWSRTVVAASAQDGAWIGQTTLTLSSGRNYYLRARTSGSVPSEWSSVITLRTRDVAMPPAPAAPSLLLLGTSGGSMTVRAGSAGTLSWRRARATAGADSLSQSRAVAADEAVTLTGLQPDTLYTLVLVAAGTGEGTSWGATRLDVVTGPGAEQFGR
jgi:hypothetical protein